MELLIIGTGLSISLGLVSSLLALLTRRGTISANRIFGLKTKNTLKSDEAWQRGHEAAEPWLWAALVIGLSGALGALQSAIAQLAEAGTIVAWTTCALTVFSLVLGTIKADKTAAEV